MDITSVVVEVAGALLAILVPVILAYVGYWAKRALAALETKRYADALREYDVELYARLMDAGRAAIGMAKDRAVSFTEAEVKPFLYKTAQEVSDAFSSKTGVRVDLNEKRVDALIAIAIESAKRAYELEQAGYSRPMTPPSPR